VDEGGDLEQLRSSSIIKKATHDKNNISPDARKNAFTELSLKVKVPSLAPVQCDVNIFPPILTTTVYIPAIAFPLSSLTMKIALSFRFEAMP